MPNHTTYPSIPGEIDQLNLAAFVPQTRVLGPGLRAGVWVQGCPFACPGCIAPEWIPRQPNQLTSISDLARRILSEPISGLTISGGEPFLQAPALAELLRLLRQERDLNCIVFSGYTHAMLQRIPRAAVLLESADLLIDGSYVAARDTGVGLRGSDNQNFHFLTPRLKTIDYPFETVARDIELHLQGNDLLVVGIPAHGVQVALDRALQFVHMRPSRLASQSVMAVRV